MGIVLFLRKEAFSVNTQFFHAAYGACLGNLQEDGPSLKAALVCEISHVLSLGHVSNVFHTMSLEAIIVKWLLNIATSKEKVLQEHNASYF